MGSTGLFYRYQVSDTYFHSGSFIRTGRKQFVFSIVSIVIEFMH